jgi:hypothetical protein
MIHPQFNRSAAAAAAVMVLTMANTSHAQTAARDSEGALRPLTAAEAQALAPAASAKEARVGMLTGKINPQPIVHANGTVEQELDASTMSYTVARINADGSVSKVCVNGEAAAQKAMKPTKTKGSVVKVSAAKGYFHDVK